MERDRDKYPVKIQVMQAIAGAMTGAMTRVVTHPFDVLKIRFQIQVEPLSDRSKWKYQSILQGFRKVYVEEGARGLMRGHSSGQVMSISYAIVQYWSYERFRSLARTVSYLEDHPSLRHFLCGGFSGCMGAVASQPFDVVRTLVVVVDPNSKRSNMRPIEGVRLVYRKFGWRGLMTGLPFTMAETFPLVGINFLIYKYLNSWVLAGKHEHNCDVHSPRTGQCTDIHSGYLFVNGALAGVVAKTLIYPVDLLRKRIQLVSLNQNQTQRSSPDCPTVLQCIVATFRIEGLHGFYKGIMPTLIKSALTSAFYFTIYDVVNRRFIAPRKEELQ
ncbi:mitochondrial thiamine pyrophosphate carrier [Drosophila serrata]|uniref:mitochondrial thiamine pyrophosphate carrier n=1 Tax=Drosophila serrata TaxID=7274 RepID=UPI000A1D186A|nr:mitochondrial thiamine pyrophosphate carrier [Drosophila serrata]KAH8376080.1 hypothetical protein KR200_002559 [Drosophila serrata]